VRPVGEAADDGDPEEVRAAIAATYADFARHAGDSPCFVAWSEGVAGDPEVQDWVAALPAPKRQPNLVFAAARWHGCPAPADYDALRTALLGDDGRVRATVLERATQTNEAGRMATLLPAISAAAGDGPLALVEAGASAGLCLFPDRWGYSWTSEDAWGVQLGPAHPVLQCEVAGPVPLPTRVPDVAWRGGVDLHPLDVVDADQMLWLSYLVWPEHADRRAVLAQAVAMAREEPPTIRRGDLLEELPDLVAEAGRHGTAVVFHTAVASYLDRAGRDRLTDLMTGLVAEGACHWVSNEGYAVLPRVSGALADVEPDGDLDFVLGIDGHPVALSHGHGRRMVWLD